MAGLFRDYRENIADKTARRYRSRERFPSTIPPGRESRVAVSKLALVTIQSTARDLENILFPFFPSLSRPFPPPAVFPFSLLACASARAHTHKDKSSSSSETWKSAENSTERVQLRFDFSCRRWRDRGQAERGRCT